MMITPPPCRQNCPDRSPTCHTDCEKYREYWEQNERRRENYYKSIKTEDYTYERCTRIERMKRKSKRK